MIYIVYWVVSVLCGCVSWWWCVVVVMRDGAWWYCLVRCAWRMMRGGGAWYVGGGLVQPESEEGAQWKAILMKSVDQGVTFSTVLNVTAPSSDPGKGIGSLMDVACSSADTCYVASACFDTNCGDRYGAFVHKTTDGGQSWKQLGFFYESSMNIIQLRGKDEIFIGGGGVGLFDSAVVWHSKDGGASFTNTTLKGGPGLVFDMSFTQDGTGAFLTSINAVSSQTTIYQMTA